MVGKVRELLESYDFNISHDMVVSGSGTAGSNVFLCNIKGLHRGDITNHGKIIDINFDSVVVADTFSEDITELQVKVYDVVNDQWLEDTLEYQVKPIIELYVPLAEKTVIEYHSGTGSDILVLNNKNVKQILEIRGGQFSELISGEGLLRGGFPKGDHNIKVVYTYGGEITDDIKRACVLLLGSFALGFIGASTGGGSLNVQGYGRNYGARGKFHDIREEFDRWAYSILKRYSTGVVGQ